MIIYKVTETIIELNRVEGEGYYSSLSGAENAILHRVAELYTDEEMENFKFEQSDDGYQYRTSGNEYLFDCLYDIEEVALDEPIM